MQDEKGNAVVPDTFIGAAERHILMPAIDRWIITHVFPTVRATEGLA
jgi:EAL domain-containing protein (putative c-di-GMP-specific phosphodiesterase class I)